MVVVDIRNFFEERNVDLIEVNNDFIYYSEEKSQEGHNNLFLLEYNRVTKRERIIVNYSLDDPSFNQHMFSFENSIILLLENESNVFWVFKIDKKTGEETTRLKSDCIGSFDGCTMLDENNFIIYSKADAYTAKVFDDYEKATGCSHIACLYNINDGKRSFIKDKRIYKNPPSNITTYDYKGKPQVLILEPYGDEALKEKCYKNSRWINTNICDYIWTCPLDTLISDIKNEKSEISMKLIVKASTEGMARFCGMDDEFIYFRAGNFKTLEDCICTYSKNTSEIKILTPLTYENNCYYHIDISETKVYRISEDNNMFRVTGVVNSNVYGEYSVSLGEFIGCIDDRYLIIKKSTNFEDSNGTVEYNSIFDTENLTEENFECKCCIKGDTLVLY